MRRIAVSILTGMLVMAGVALAQSAGAVGWLGVYSQQITPELRDGINYNGSGALVSRVVPDSPADRAGIQRGDVIIRVGSSDVDSPEGLIRVVRGAPVGSSMDVLVIRDGQKKRLDVTLVARPDGDNSTPSPDRDNDDVVPPAPMRFHVMTPGTPSPDVVAPRWHSHDNDNDNDNDHDGDKDDDSDRSDDSPPMIFRGGPGMSGMSDLPGVMGMMGRGRLGVRIETLSPDLASYFGGRTQGGALVLEVTKGSAAEEAGIRAGDVITRVEGREIKDADDLMEAVRSSEGRVSISLVRHGERQSIEAALPKADRIMRWQGNGPGGGSNWKRGADGSWNWSSPDGSKHVKRIVIDRDKDRDGAELDDHSSDDVKALRDEVRQLREELRQLREKRAHDNQDEDNR